MKLGRASLFLLGLSLLLLIALTVFESALVGMPLWAERVVTFLLLILPAGIGAVLGVMSLLRREGHAWLTVIAIVLNTIFAIFHLMIVLFAG